MNQPYLVWAAVFSWSRLGHTLAPSENWVPIVDAIRGRLSYPDGVAHEADEVQPANRPFPSSEKSHFQNEAKCEAIDMKMIFNYYANKTHFHNKGFALSLVLKARFFGTRKWSIKLID